ncbi:hypothetical protein [Mesorhizobium sp.]
MNISRAAEEGIAKAISAEKRAGGRRKTGRRSRALKTMSGGLPLAKYRPF